VGTPPHITDPGGRPTPVSSPVQTRKREVQFATQQVQPPTPLYLQPEDSFRVQVHLPTLILPILFQVTMRWLRPDGEIVTTRKPFNATAAFQEFTFTLGEGFLLSANISPITALPLDPGTFYVNLLIERDTPEGGFYMWVLIADYMDGYHYPTWPFGRQIFSHEGPGSIRSIVGTTPGAGAEVSETVPSNVRWELIAFRISLVTSAVVATRKPSFTIDDGLNVLLQSDSNAAIAASNNGQATLANVGFANPIVTNAACLAPCPPIMLFAGFRIRTVTSSIDVGDQYASPKYLVRQWVSG
jgi:hypothetical protein